MRVQPSQPPLQLQASTREDRQVVIHTLRDAVNRAGWIRDFTLFSNAALALQFVVEVGALATLRDALGHVAVQLDAASETALNERVSGAEICPERVREDEVYASLFVTFIHSDPDLSILVPHVPG